MVKSVQIERLDQSTLWSTTQLMACSSTRLSLRIGVWLGGVALLACGRVARWSVGSCIRVDLTSATSGGTCGRIQRLFSTKLDAGASSQREEHRGAIINRF